MKKIFILLLALMALSSGKAQPCFPEGIYFSTQAQIDNFSANNPGCTEIEGTLTINGYNISSLTGLNGITSIGGSLRILCNLSLPGLSGLNNLVFVGGNLYIEGNLLLSSLTGLDNLAYIGGALQLTDNIVLESLSGLEGLTSIGSNLWINDNAALTDLTGLNNVVSITGMVRIYSNNALSSLSGLENLSSIGGSLSIGGDGHLGGLGNPMLVSLQALQNLTSIGGSIVIGYNTALANLSGLDNIDPGSIINLSVYNNGLLTNCEVQSICSYLLNPGGVVLIDNNATGCNSISEITEACALIPVDDNRIDNTISVYPNPSNGQLCIETSVKQEGSRLYMMDYYGKKLFSNLITGTKTNIDISNLSNGIYYMMLIGEPRIRVGKVIKTDR